VNHLSAFELGVAAVSFLLALAAWGVNTFAAYRSGVMWRPWHAAVAILAGIYSMGYCWLLFTHVDPSVWSGTMRYVGLVTWPVVWITPALLARQQAKEIQRRLAEYIEEGGRGVD
jgi:hypothetical protein